MSSFLTTEKTAMHGIYKITKTNNAQRLSLENEEMIFSLEPYKITIEERNDSLESKPHIKDEVTLYDSGKLKGSQIKERIFPNEDNIERFLSSINCIFQSKELKNQIAIVAKSITLKALLI